MGTKHPIPIQVRAEFLIDSLLPSDPASHRILSQELLNLPQNPSFPTWYETFSLNLKGMVRSLLLLWRVAVFVIEHGL